MRAASVLTTDPFVSHGPSLLSLEEVLARADVVVIGAPHDAYAKSEISQPVVDIWNLRGGGVVI